MTTTRIQKWGNSFGLRIPKNIIEELALPPETRFDIRQEQGRIIITPIQERKLVLGELLDQITPENLPAELDWGDAVGREVW